MILARKFLTKAKISLDFKHGYIQWLKQTIAMKSENYWVTQFNFDNYLNLSNNEADNDENKEIDTSYASEILDSKYEKNEWQRSCSTTRSSLPV